MLSRNFKLRSFQDVFEFGNRAFAGDCLKFSLFCRGPKDRGLLIMENKEVEQKVGIEDDSIHKRRGPHQRP